MSTEAIDTAIDDISKRKKRPDRPIYVPKVVKRDEPITSKPSSSRTRLPAIPSPLVARRISNASNADSADGSDHSRETSSTVKSREHREGDEDLPRASFYRVGPKNTKIPPF